MTARNPISRNERVRIFDRHEGRCHLCGRKIGAGEPWEVSHPTPLEMGGADDDTNRKPAHRSCHRDHTSTVDIPMIAKVKRIRAKHIGVPRKSARPLPGGKDSRFKKKVSGEVVPRFPTSERG